MKFLFSVALVCTSLTCKAEDTARYLVRYKNKKGLEEVRGLDDPGHAALSVQYSNIMSRHQITTIRATPEAIETLKASKNIEMVEEDLEVSLLPTIPGDSPSTASEDTPYGITMVQAPELWAITEKRKKMTVCVIDTGYNAGHEDLPTKSDHDVDGWNGGTGGVWDVDGNGHGTHCAGTIGAIGGNDLGVTSVNPDPTAFKFYIGKGLSDSGSAPWSNVLEAVEKCASAGAKVISMSLGGACCNDPIHEGVYRRIYDDDILIIAAAGNNGNNLDFWPASYKHVMSVGAVDNIKNKAGFSVFNDQTEIAAPGVNVESTYKDGTNSYKSLSGTSMACPHVAGVALMLWSYFPACKNSQIRNVLLRSAEDRGDGQCNPQYGHGIIQGKAAYDLLKAEGCAAGGVPTVPLSDNNNGGCEQGPPTDCVDDSSFSKKRGGRDRTCDYIGESGDYRRRKWCNKKYRGVMIHRKCCATCTGFAQTQ
eukprot:CAMPEP_0194278538 /NCGR_PEP_ID=MMETSP0169-20130528/11595_1 /TAXON_ID=218684 /ORGANISM="Corethron pennatum, Strain L29A3" /LENGTH=477 /DNA_ID=CAMNT_0039022751 /DNA_START=90 /DNA_END=1523 /DNA_ORIENTATION=-